jgi:bacterioferritin-associated ferredoxin
MIVCLCHRLSDRDIERQVAHGVHSFDALQDETCIARNCGCCEQAAREVFDAALGKVIVLRCEPVAA